jgi:lipoate-protein ligase A
MWRFLNTGLQDGHFNMALDEQLVEQLLGGTGCPTVRVYGWRPHAVSLGFHQRENEIDLAICGEGGIDVVRRPTGGRAILHAHELTYSVVTWAGGRSVLEIYRHISNALLQSLRFLGIPAAESASGGGAAIHNRGEKAILCFASTSKYEIQVGGKKVVGSAQRRYASDDRSGEHVVLQHGSILLGPEHRRLAELISAEKPRTREILRHLLESKTTEVETVLNRPVTFEETADAVKKGFEHAWGISFDADADPRPDFVLNSSAAYQHIG